MRTPILESNFEAIRAELSGSIAGATWTWHQKFVRNNIKITTAEVSSLIDLHLLMSIRKWRTGKWTDTTTKCKFESFFHTHNNCMLKCFLDKHCGIYGKKKDGTKYIKNRERIPEQYLTSLSATFIDQIEGGAEQEDTQKIQVIPSQKDRDPADLLVAGDLIEKFLKSKPKYGPLIAKLIETESIEDTAAFFHRSVQSVYAKAKRIKKYLIKMDAVIKK